MVVNVFNKKYKTDNSQNIHIYISQINIMLHADDNYDNHKCQFYDVYYHYDHGNSNVMLYLSSK